MKIILYLILLFCTTSISYTQWVQLPNGLESSRIYCIAINGNRIIAGTEGKGVYLSNNYGDKWEPIGLATQRIGSIAFSGNTILAGSDGSGIFISSDNGKSWNNPLTFDMIYTITKGNNKIFAGAFNGLYFSTDNGNNWIKENKMNSSIGNIVAIGNTVIVSTPVGVYKSTDNGVNWAKSSNGLDDGEYFALAISENIIYTSSGNKIFLSTDYGNSWIKKTDVKTDLIFTLAAYANNVFAGTFRENIFLSTDNGSNWVKKDKGLIGQTVKSLVINNDDIFAATDAGVFRAKLSDMLSTDVTEDLENSKHLLISPNPASNFIDISKLDNDINFIHNSAKLVIYNTIGEIVLSESIDPNSGNLRLDIEFLPPGLYYVKIGNHFEKFVKL